MELNHLVKLARDLTRPMGPPNGGLVREITGYFREIDRLVKYYSIWPDGVQGYVRVIAPKEN